MMGSNKFKNIEIEREPNKLERSNQQSSDGNQSPLIDLRNINSYIYGFEDQGLRAKEEEPGEVAQFSHRSSFDGDVDGSQGLPENVGNERTLDLTNYQSKNQNWPSKNFGQRVMPADEDKIDARQTTYNYTDSSKKSEPTLPKNQLHSISPSELHCRERYNGSASRRDLEEAATVRVSAANSAPRLQEPITFDERLTSSKKSETCLRMSELELLSASKTQDRVQQRILDPINDKTPHKKISQIPSNNSPRARPVRIKTTPLPSK